MRHRKLKMFGFAIACILSVPLMSVVLYRLPFVQADNFRFVLTAIVYPVIILLSIAYLHGKVVEKSELAVSAVVMALTVAYTIPISAIGIIAAIASAAAFLVLCQLKKSGAVDIKWIQKSASTNLWLLGGITAFYFCIYIARHGAQFFFIPIYAVQCLSPAVSEEIIFRGVFSAGLFLLFRLDNDFPSNLWVFLVVTVPFAFLHFPELFLSNSVDAILLQSAPIFFNTLIGYWLMKKYGLIYAIYAHALNDYLAFMSMYPGALLQ